MAYQYLPLQGYSTPLLEGFFFVPQSLLEVSPHFLIYIRAVTRLPDRAWFWLEQEFVSLHNYYYTIFVINIFPKLMALKMVFILWVPNVGSCLVAFAEFYLQLFYHSKEEQKTSVRYQCINDTKSTQASWFEPKNTKWSVFTSQANLRWFVGVSQVCGHGIISKWKKNNTMKNNIQTAKWFNFISYVWKFYSRD